jgi:hypothetical protein
MIFINQFLFLFEKAIIPNNTNTKTGGSRVFSGQQQLSVSHFFSGFPCFWWCSATAGGVF